MARLVGILLLLFTLSAKAEGLVVHGISYHTTGNNFNNINYGIGYTPDDKIYFGVFRNSESSEAAYVSYKFGINNYISVNVGAAYGYKSFPVVPILMPTLTIPIDRIFFVIGFLPYYDAKRGNLGIVVHSMIEYRL
jgi:hypothetical protein